MENKTLREKFTRLVTSCNTFTMATSMGGISWSTPLFYIYTNSVFYFVSNPSSRHINEATVAKQTSCSLYSHYKTWDEIRGIQMEGRVEIAGKGIDSLMVIKKYMENFPSAADIKGKKTDFTEKNFLNLFHVRLYRFIPETVFYIDNSVKFGFRAKVFL